MTTLEVKSGYGLMLYEELRQLELLERSRGVDTDGACDHVPRRARGAGRGGRDAYVSEVLGMLDAVVERSACARSTTSRASAVCSRRRRRRVLFERSRSLGVPTRCHADAWAGSEGWQTAVAGGAISAEHLTYTPDDEISAVGETDTIAVLLPQAELIYMTDRRASARLFVDVGVPVAVATDYCSSIHATSLPVTLGMAAPWFRMTPGEVIVGGTLNAAYALGPGGRSGSLDLGKRGDLTSCR